jgi:hypothetical protein
MPPGSLEIMLPQQADEIITRRVGKVNNIDINHVY